MYELLVVASVIGSDPVTTFKGDIPFTSEQACLNFTYDNVKSLNNLMHRLLGKNDNVTISIQCNKIHAENHDVIVDS